MSDKASTPEARRRRLVMLATAMAVAFLVLPYLFWHRTWFGRPLRDTDIAGYLNDDSHPRRIQHALAQLSERMARGDSAARAHYPRVVALASHPLAEIRTTVAWLMGQDNDAEAFHRALLVMLGDPDLMVRRNAALALTRFRDPGGRAELLAMLQPIQVPAPAAGRVTVDATPKHQARRGATLARIAAADGREIAVRAPVAGEIALVLAANGTTVQPGTPLVTIAPDPDHAWEALRGLYLVGEPDDLQTVEHFRAAQGLPDRVREQAAFTARAIRTRAVTAP